jgi:hypothetical protein
MVEIAAQMPIKMPTRSELEGTHTMFWNRSRLIGNEIAFE